MPDSGHTCANQQPQTTANYMAVVTQKGLVIVDRDSIDEATKTRLESLGYVVIEKQAGRSVEVLTLPTPRISYPQLLYGQAQPGGPYIAQGYGPQGVDLNGR